MRNDLHIDTLVEYESIKKHFTIIAYVIFNFKLKRVIYNDCTKYVTYCSDNLNTFVS